MRCMGAFDRCACTTICTIWASMVVAPTRSERMTIAPVVFSVAPMSLSPTPLATGIASPVSMDSSTELLPSITTPSTGTFSPGRTRKVSPTRTWVNGTSVSVPSGWMARAVLGARPSSDLMAAEVCERAFSSSIWPSNVNEMIAAAASKYTETRPIETNDAGNSCGAAVAAML